MPKESSRTAPVTFLDADALVERLRRAAEQLCEREENVVAVVLFGSLASGRATPGSDADLLVVLRADPRRILDRIPDYSRPFEAPGLGVQVLPWTEYELQARVKTGDRFAQEVVSSGKVLAGSLQPSAAKR